MVKIGMFDFIKNANVRSAAASRGVAADGGSLERLVGGMEWNVAQPGTRVESLAVTQTTENGKDARL